MGTGHRVFPHWLCDAQPRSVLEAGLTELTHPHSPPRSRAPGPWLPPVFLSLDQAGWQTVAYGPH